MGNYQGGWAWGFAKAAEVPWIQQGDTTFRMGFKENTRTPFLPLSLQGAMVWREPETSWP